MNWLLNRLKVYMRVVNLSFKITPISSSVMVGYYVLDSFFPSLFIILHTGLFDSVATYLEKGGSYEKMIYQSVLIVACYALQHLSNVVCNMIINIGVYEKYISHSRLIIAEKAAEIPHIYYENAEIMDMRQRALECVELEKLSQLFMSAMVFLTSGISVVSVSIILAQYSAWFILISLVSVIPYFIIRVIRGKEFYYLKHQQAKKSRKLDYLWSLFTNKVTAKEMRVMGFGNYLHQSWTKLRNEVNQETWEHNLKDCRSLFLCDILKIVGYGICMMLSIMLCLMSKITLGVFAASISAFSDMQDRTKSFLTEMAFLPELLRYADDYFSFIDLPTSPKSKYENKNTYDYQNQIIIKDAYFKYPNAKKYAIENINLTIRKGETIVILGENGSGKTTLCKLIQRLYCFDKGIMEIDDVNFSKIETVEWWKKISLVNQDFVKYNLSLCENIVISDIEKAVDHDTVRVYLEKIGTQLFETGKIQDYDIQMGREYGGMELSVGQWQKLAIARGLFRDSELIFMDEPTSALDPVIETAILEKFLVLSKRKTAIIISHRVGLSKFADRVLVMKNGCICEEGTHDKLLALDGEYARLYQAQSKWYH